MSKIVSILKKIIRVAAVRFAKLPKKNIDSLPEISAIWSGSYSSWIEASSLCTGYDKSNILEKCKNALLKVMGGEAVYERDSVLFDEIQYSWGLLAGLQRAALKNNGKICVIDFGGSLGSTYYQNRDFLRTLNQLEWCIVEQSNFVDYGKQYFESSELKFYHSIDECVAKHQPDVLILSGVLQYLEKPHDWIRKFIDLKIDSIIIDRTSFVEDEVDILTIQKVPETIYDASYPSWFFGNTFMKTFETDYHVISYFDNGFTPPIILNNEKRAHWSGAILIAK